MNSIIVELYELSDAMVFLEECMDGLSVRGSQQLAGNAYIFGLFGRRLSELAESLERDPKVSAPLENSDDRLPHDGKPPNNCI
ncbi:MAG: hypothetical protein ACOCWR_03205 [Oceanidesulfovibrio sp.]